LIERSEHLPFLLTVVKLKNIPYYIYTSCSYHQSILQLTKNNPKQHILKGLLVTDHSNGFRATTTRLQEQEPSHQS